MNSGKQSNVPIYRSMYVICIQNHIFTLVCGLRTAYRRRVDQVIAETLISYLIILLPDRTCIRQTCNERFQAK